MASGLLVGHGLDCCWLSDLMNYGALDDNDDGVGGDDHDNDDVDDDTNYGCWLLAGLMTYGF